MEEAAGSSIEITLQHNQQSLRLPRKAISLLSTIISNMAAGKSMAIILSDTAVGPLERVLSNLEGTGLVKSVAKLRS